MHIARIVKKMGKTEIQNQNLRSIYSKDMGYYQIFLLYKITDAN